MVKKSGEITVSNAILKIFVDLFSKRRVSYGDGWVDVEG